MVQIRGICIIHLPDLLFGNFPGKVNNSPFCQCRTSITYMEHRAYADKSEGGYSFLNPLQLSF